MTTDVGWTLPRRRPGRVTALRDVGYWTFGLQIFALVFLQKLAIPIAGLPISLPMIVLYLGLPVMLFRGQLHLPPVRLAAMGLLTAVVVVTQVTIRTPFSAPSLLQFLLLYLPFVFAWRVAAEKYVTLMNIFQNAMLAGGAMVFVQLASQAALGLGKLPSLETFVPAAYLLHGYNYAAPIAWGQQFVRPNGFFFLEPSFASSFLASALIVELKFFHRLWRIVFYAAALLGTFAATGIVMVLAAAPLLLVTRNLRAAVVTGFAAVVGVVLALATGALDVFFSRFSELGSQRSSAFQRLIAPLDYLRQVYQNPNKVFVGVGAGNSNEIGVSLWPMAKVMIEYGALAGLVFMVALAICMGRSVNRPLALALFIAYNFTGGFLLVPITVIQILLLVCLLQIYQPSRARRRRRLSSNQMQFAGNGASPVIV
jgi:hypothetical protein